MSHISLVNVMTFQISLVGVIKLHISLVDVMTSQISLVAVMTGDDNAFFLYICIPLFVYSVINISVSV